MNIFEHKYFILIIAICSLIISIYAFKSYNQKKRGVPLFVSVSLLTYSLMMICIFADYNYTYYHLYEYDLNSNGIFESNEQNQEQQDLWEKCINDTGVNFAPFTLIIPSLFLGTLSILLRFITKKIGS